MLAEGSTLADAPVEAGTKARPLAGKQAECEARENANAKTGQQATTVAGKKAKAEAALKAAPKAAPMDGKKAQAHALNHAQLDKFWSTFLTTNQHHHASASQVAALAQCGGVQGLATDPEVNESEAEEAKAAKEEPKEEPDAEPQEQRAKADTDVEE